MEFNQEVPTVSDECDWLLNQSDDVINNDQEDHTLALWNHIGKSYSLIVRLEDNEYVLYFIAVAPDYKSWQEHTSVLKAVLIPKIQSLVIAWHLRKLAANIFN